MSEQKHPQYLFTFTPISSFSFSGETSARTKGIDDTFLKADPNASRRQSFLVETSTMPPQTTVMGAVRRVLYGRNDISIGNKSFHLANEEKQDMGDIVAISPVFLIGKQANGEEIICLPAPAAVPYSNSYTPVTPEDFKAKEGTTKCFLMYSAKDGRFVGVKRQSEFTKVYMQPVVRIANRTARADGYHLQSKCRFNNEVLENASFGVVVTLAKEIACSDMPSAMQLTLGSKDSCFTAVVRPNVPFQINELSYQPEKQNEKPYWALSLLSASVLPKDWNMATGLVQAFVEKKTMRCAISDTNFHLTLIPEKLVLADAGSVFLFDSKEARETFAQKISEDPRTQCGLNQTMKYEILG